MLSLKYHDEETIEAMLVDLSEAVIKVRLKNDPNGPAFDFQVGRIIKETCFLSRCNEFLLKRRRKEWVCEVQKPIIEIFDILSFSKTFRLELIESTYSELDFQRSFRRVLREAKLEQRILNLFTRLLKEDSQALGAFIDKIELVFWLDKDIPPPEKKEKRKKTIDLIATICCYQKSLKDDTFDRLLSVYQQLWGTKSADEKLDLLTSFQTLATDANADRSALLVQSDFFKRVIKEIGTLTCICLTKMANIVYELGKVSRNAYSIVEQDYIEKLAPFIKNLNPLLQGVVLKSFYVLQRQCKEATVKLA